MNQFNQDGSNARNAVITASDAAVAAALSSDRQENTPPYMKLIADCWEHILDYLGFKDIGSLSETCKRMHQMVTYYLRENFPSFPYMLIGKEVLLEIYKLYYFRFPVEYSRFVSTLRVLRGRSDYLLDAAVFHSLKALEFSKIAISRDHIPFTYAVLQQIEKLDFTFCSFEHEVFESMIDLCPKLKTLNIYGCSVTGMIFLQHYPALEHFKVLFSSYKLIPELKIFLEKHTQLKRFESDFKFLWVSRTTLYETNARLDQLIVHIYEYDEKIPFDQFIDFLKNLHAHEFFKTLHFVLSDCVSFYFQRLSPKLSTLASTLTGLRASYPIDDSITELSSLINLKEIYFNKVSRSSERIEIIAKGLVNLEKLTIGKVNDGEIEPFVRHSKRLKEIRIRKYGCDTPIDLIQLNNQRKQLENANPIVIFVSEKIYLPAKWNSKYLNLDLIKISRIEPKCF